MKSARKISSIIVGALRLFFRDPGASWITLQMALQIVLLSLLMKLLSLSQALQLMSSQQSSFYSQLTQAEKMALANRFATLLDGLLRIDYWVFTPTCWKRAIILHRWLAKHGLPSQIVFGIARQMQSITGHAWLEFQGQPILEAQPPEYLRTYVFPSR